VPCCKKRVPCCKKRVLCCKKRVLCCKKRVLCCKKRVPCCKKRVLCCKKRVPCCKKRVLCCKRWVLFCKLQRHLWRLKGLCCKLQEHVWRLKELLFVIEGALLIIAGFFPQIKKIYAEQMNGDNPTLRASRLFSLRTLRLKLVMPVSHARLNARAERHGKHGELYFNAVFLTVKKTG
jgi:uncharacterized membrane protein